MLVSNDVGIQISIIKCELIQLFVVSKQQYLASLVKKLSISH